MLNEFVEKIVVHERDRKGSVETTQEVEIYFNFIGRYLPPHFGEVKMTPEEMRNGKTGSQKRQASPDYLRRKANGKQQEYYERTKAKRKPNWMQKKKRSGRKILQKVCSFRYHCFPQQNRRKELHQHEQIRKNHSR